MRDVHYHCRAWLNRSSPLPVHPQSRKARQKISRRKSKFRETIHLGTKLCPCVKTWKKKYCFIDKILLPWKTYRFSCSSSPSSCSSSWSFDETSVWLLFNWRKFLTPVFVNKVPARGLTDAVGAYACRRPEHRSQGGGKCCRYSSGCMSSVLPPSRFRARSRLGSTDGTRGVPAALPHALQLNPCPVVSAQGKLLGEGTWTQPIPGSREASRGSLKRPKGTRGPLFLPARQERHFRQRWGTIDSESHKRLRVLDCLNLGRCIPLMSAPQTGPGQRYPPTSRPLTRQ